MIIVRNYSLQQESCLLLYTTGSYYPPPNAGQLLCEPPRIPPAAQCSPSRRFFPSPLSLLKNIQAVHTSVVEPFHFDSAPASQEGGSSFSSVVFLINFHTDDPIKEWILLLL